MEPPKKAVEGDAKGSRAAEGAEAKEPRKAAQAVAEPVPPPPVPPPPVPPPVAIPTAGAPAVGVASNRQAASEILATLEAGAKNAPPARIVAVPDGKLPDAELNPALPGGLNPALPGMQYHPLLIYLNTVRANSKVLIVLRDDSDAVWSEGDGKGIVGLSITTVKDSVLRLSSFLVNAREMFLQTYEMSQDICIQLFVLTSQSSVRGRVDLPPGASVTLQSRCDRTSLIGLSSFSVEF